MENISSIEKKQSSKLNALHNKSNAWSRSGVSFTIKAMVSQHEKQTNG
jgi:hypothetical protein